MTIFMILSITLLVLAFSYFAYRITFFSPESHRAGVDDPLKGDQYEAVADNIARISHIMERAAFEGISIEAYDGTRLFGRYYHLKDGAPVEILFHGYRSHAFRDCSGGHALSRKMGFNALVVDQRAHGNSGGHTISFGIRERHDVLSWIQYMNSRFGSDSPIILSGLSMGAATVLMSASLSLPKNVACIIADAPFSSPAAIIEKVCADEHYPVALCRPFIHLGALIYGGFRLNEIDAKTAVRNTDIPILLIHGEDDRFVPCSMSREIATCSNGHAEIQTFPKAGHGLCYMTDPIRYEQSVLEFICRIPSLSEAINPEFMKQYFES